MEKHMLNVIFEDKQIIVVVKPQNVPSQEDDTKDPDMLNMVKDYIKQKDNKPGNVYVGLVHRLDRPTGGVMVFAKTSKSASRLGEQIKTGEMRKSYLTVVMGTVEKESDYLVNYLSKNDKTNKVTIVGAATTDAKKAELKYKVLETANNLSLLKISLLTGRSHQIRAQLAHIGYPVFGDVKYGKEDAVKANLALWAYELTLTHPTTKQTHTFKVYPQQDRKPWNNFHLNISK
jgi:23S rRNA pseudouridine1911/1915/1917 synthase